MILNQGVTRLLLVFLLVYTFLPAPARAKAKEFDICVYGETPAGIMAAIQAARMGKSVVLLSTSSTVGGVMTSGLTATDINKYKAIGGIAREVFQRLYAYYADPKAWKYQDREAFFELSKKRTFTGKNDSLKMQWVYESHVLEGIFKDMLKKAKVKVVYNQLLDLNKGVIKNGQAIAQILTTSGQVFKAKMFIDATYEGDLMARAGVSYFAGREPNSQYKETLSGIYPGKRVGSLTKSIDPFVKEGDPGSGLLPYIEEGSKLGPKGSGDSKMQAYTFRVTLTNEPKNRVKILKPENYNPLLYEYILRSILLDPSVPLTKVITITPMPNKKTDTNHLDFIGASHAWPEADHETRRKIRQQHKDYAIGLLWFLANDPRLPASIRGQMQEWGFPKDEFKKNGHFPTQIYVRETRRMKSDYMMTQHHAKRVGAELAPYSVGLGTYAMDSHYTGLFRDQDGEVYHEGGFFSAARIYPISYLSIVPAKNECTNLVVPICLSASHVAFSSIRMEPVYMVLGQSAGTAAALSIDHKSSVQELPYEHLRARLLADKQILEADNKMSK
ncbi:MAG: FAD-dependent oxidoreductase [Adhaeribacter sp.]